MDTKTLRVRALRRLIGQQPLKDFADANELDASYLSQILNGHRGMGEKAAATMADKIGVPRDVLVNPKQTEPDEHGQQKADREGVAPPEAPQELTIDGLLARLNLHPHTIGDKKLREALIYLLSQYQEDPKRGAEIASAILLLSKKD